MTAVPVVNGLVFDGIDREKYPGCVVYKGPFGTRYPIATDCSAFKLQHAQRVVARKGALTGSIMTVIGVHEKALWLHLVEANVAVQVKNASNSVELETEVGLRPAEYPPGCLREVDTAGNVYTFDTSRLEEVFSLKKEEAISLHGKINCTVLGELFGCLWVRISGAATPLPGAVNAASAHSLYEISEPFDPNATTLTPRRTASTPRSARPPFTLVQQKQVAVCEGAFGNSFEADTSKKALSVFGVSHGQVLIASNGALRGKKVTIVGVHLGSLWVLVEGDRRVSCIRNCENGDELREAYGFGSGGTSPSHSTKADANDKASSQREKEKPITPRNTVSGTQLKATAAKQPTNDAGGAKEEGQSPRGAVKKKPFLAWTSFGRSEFDASSTATAPFGYSHGQSLKASRGVDKDKVFHVVGTLSGSLWVIEEGKPRAVPLRHCQTKDDIQQRFGFTIVGRKDLTPFANAEEEPSFTPVQTPRGASTLASPRESSTPRSIPASSMLSVPQTVPALNFGVLSLSPPVAQPTAAAAAPTASSSNSLHGYGASHDAEEEAAPEAASVTGTGTGSCHRNYLKAVALLKTGAHASSEDPLRFHKYYMTNTGQRLAHAMNRINTFREAYDAFNGPSHFSRASTDEMLAIMRRKAELFT